MELRSRSRSKTPFQTQSFIEAENFESVKDVVVTRSSKKTTTVRNSKVATSAPTKPIKTRRSTRLFKTSDYSSEEGESETFSHISQNEKNQIIEDAKAAANGTTEISALNLYRKAGRYWDKYPKTDYTYSPHSRDRVELAPGVVQMPNMSRRTIHSYDSSTNTDSDYTIRQRLFNSYIQNNNIDEVDESYKIHRITTSWRRRFISIFTSIYTVIYWCFYSVYRVQNSSVLYIAKKFHHLASRLMLLDTWLLKKTKSGRRTKAVIALCLLPLLLFTAWWLLSFLGNAVYSSYFIPNPSIDEKIIEIQTQASIPIFQAEPSAVTEDIVEKILQNPQFLNFIAGTQRDEDNDNLLRLVDELKGELQKIRLEMSNFEQAKSVEFSRLLSQYRAENMRNIAHLTQKLTRCCNNKPIIDLQPYLNDLLNNPKFLNEQRGFTEWLNAVFVAKQELEGHLANLTKTLSKKYDSSIENTANVVMEEVVGRLSNRPIDGDALSEERIRKIVQSSLVIYDADKTGLVDYAMEPMGGEILTTRCTESYHAGTAVISILGIPIWYPSNSPRIVIVPGINPGECWAFQNFPGFIVIKLATRVRIEAFSMEHISRLLVPEGKIDSAPKEFEVYGLNKENEKEPIKIGEYVYDYNGDSIQFFAAQQHGLVFSIVEVRVKSNHGNPNYTCLYRFRVHGKVSNEPS